MGNCVLKGSGVVEEMVKVVTSNGGVMELYAPITAASITDEFAGYAIFPSPRRLAPPLHHHEELCAGQYYYLLPLLQYSHKAITTQSENSNTVDQTPYRMSVDNQKLFRRRSEAAEEVLFPKYKSTKVWKVRLVINADQLSEILSQEARTEALIESVRTVAKCGGAGAAANSDQRSWTTATQNSDIYCAAS